MNIVKASGEKEKFSEAKLYESLKRAGTKPQTAKEVVKKVKSFIHPNTQSEEILKGATLHLRQRDAISAARYNLKRAIMDLGPTGYIFEDYIAAILREYGYQTVVGRLVPGRCVTHEVDVEARKDQKHFMVECKYHNDRGIYSDVKVALYTYARFLDIKSQWEKGPGHKYFFHQPWLVTNTKCTGQAIQYAACVGLRVISWRYPKDGSLERLIEDKGLYPVTILPSVSRYIKRFAENNIMLARDLLTYPTERLARLSGINFAKANRILDDAKELCV